MRRRFRWFLGLAVVVAGATPAALGLGSSAAGCVASGNAEDAPKSAVPDGGVTVVLDGGGDAATPPDGVAACPKGACNYQSGAGCGDAGSCVPLPGPGGSVAPACYAAGSTAAGAACTQWSDCAPGHLCDPTGHCRKLCCGGDWTGCSGGEHCLRGVELASDGGAVQTGAMLCYPAGGCDPLAPTSCAEPGTTCQIADPTGASACLPEGTGGAGEACPCKGGFLCVASACRRLCKAVEGGGEPFCPPGEGTCTHYTRDPAGVGECTP
jgi:hypothetical protein